jgi:hypothetical protein
VGEPRGIGHAGVDPRSTESTNLNVTQRHLTPIRQLKEKEQCPDVLPSATRVT